ncbi:MAG: response regulator transcription factor [Defluviitaleaceae bacterium]|nr:response regulator transcription factor [Defluviitaleaceae bacterium]
MSRILLVEDDDSIREIVLYALQSAGFDALGFESGEEFFVTLGRESVSPDLIVLDIMLPGDDGLTILRKLRQDPRYNLMPIIMLTAKGSELDKIKGLDMGADDYLTKPFSVMELVSRIKAVLRRSTPTVETSPQDLIYQNIRLDLVSRTAAVDGKAVLLTFKEYELLHYFMINKGVALSRDKIMEAVWGFDFEGESRTVDAHIRTLRQKLGDAGENIKTLRNVGYKLGE